MNRHPVTAEELLDKLPDVHPSMVPAYLAEATLRTLLQIRDDIRSTMPKSYDVLPEQRTEQADHAHQ